MSLATRCTACGTIFRVVEDQLRVSEGWVRCGRCQEVFNAQARLFDLEHEAPPAFMPAPADAPPVEPPAERAVVDRITDDERFLDPYRDAPVAEAPAGLAAPVAAPASASVVAASGSSADWPDPGYVWDAPGGSAAPTEDAQSWTRTMRESRPTPTGETLPADDDFVVDETASSVHGDVDAPASHPVGTSDPIAQSLMAEPAQHRRDVLDASAEPSWLEASPLPPLEGAGTRAAPGFVRVADRKAARNRPMVRRLLGATAVVLLLVLGVQAALHWRDDIAAQWPAAQAPLVQACSLIGCRLAPPQHIEDVAIESSSLTRSAAGGPARAGGADDTLDLSVSLRNRGTVAVATPHIDLSLTDVNGVLIARRALAVSDFRAAPALLPAGGDSTLHLTLATGSQRVAGYTVEAFYP